MPQAFETFSSWGEKDDRVTFVQEVQTPGYTGVINAQMTTCFRTSGLDGISAPSHKGQQSVVSPRFSLGLCRPGLQNAK